MNKKIILSIAGIVSMLSVSTANAALNPIEQIHLMNPGATVATDSTRGGATSKSWGDDSAGSYRGRTHSADWYAIMLQNAGTVTVTVVADDVNSLSPGFSMWATGDDMYHGGRGRPGHGTHFFKQTDLSPWANKGSAGDILETLGYANSGVGPITANMHGEYTYDSGVFDLTTSNIYTNGITGSTGTGLAEMVLTDLEAGWYLLAVGGADSSQAGGQFSLTVSQVPVPAAAYLFGTGLLGLIGAQRRKSVKS